MNPSSSPTELLPLTPLTLAVLLLVADEAMHGYGIARELERESLPQMVPGAGTLYAALQRMVDSGLIDEVTSPRADDDQRRRYYRITAFGREVARAELTRLTSVLENDRARRLLPRLRPALGRAAR